MQHHGVAGGRDLPVRSGRLAVHPYRATADWGRDAVHPVPLGVELHVLAGTSGVRSAVASREAGGPRGFCGRTMRDRAIRDSRRQLEAALVDLAAVSAAAA